MSIVVLTPEMPHHAHYVIEPSRSYDNACVIAERRSFRPPFEIHHLFEDQRNQYEIAGNCLLPDGSRRR